MGLEGRKRIQKSKVKRKKSKRFVRERGPFLLFNFDFLLILLNHLAFVYLTSMYAIVDIETTGGYAAANGITEIAVLVHDGQRVVKQFETLVNPGQPIPRYIQSLTGITDEMVSDAPRFEEVAATVYEMLRETVFVAHNVNFDYSFVKHHLNGAGYTLNTKKLCTVRLSRKVFPGLPSYSLGNLCRSLQISVQGRHRAGGDARATVQLFEQCLAGKGREYIQDMLRRTSGEQWLPLQLDPGDIRRLPAAPGVYYFKDQRGKILYVGKAVNLRRRVSSHFTHNEPGRRRQILLRQIAKVEYAECASELEAIVLESAEIRRLWPPYNVSQKQPQQQYGLYQFEDSRGYLRLAIDRRKKHLPCLYRFNLLHEGQVMLRKMADEFRLHEKLCSLNKKPLSAEEYTALEKPSEYNPRLQQALTVLQQQLPTFAVVDQGRNRDEQLCLLMEKGSFWGMGYLPAGMETQNIEQIREYLQPYADNDTIRNSIYSFVAKYPEKKVFL